MKKQIEKHIDILTQDSMVNIVSSSWKNIGLRDYMEDEVMEGKLSNGLYYYCLMDGHGGNDVVEYIQSRLHDLLESYCKETIIHSVTNSEWLVDKLTIFPKILDQELYNAGLPENALVTECSVESLMTGSPPERLVTDIAERSPGTLATESPSMMVTSKHKYYKCGCTFALVVYDSINDFAVALSIGDSTIAWLDFKDGDEIEKQSARVISTVGHNLTEEKELKRIQKVLRNRRTQKAKPRFRLRHRNPSNTYILCGKGGINMARSLGDFRFKRDIQGNFNNDLTSALTCIPEVHLITHPTQIIMYSDGIENMRIPDSDPTCLVRYAQEETAEVLGNRLLNQVLEKKRSGIDNLSLLTINITRQSSKKRMIAEEKEDNEDFSNKILDNVLNTIVNETTRQSAKRQKI